MNESNKSISEVLAEFAITLRYEDIPEAVIYRAKLHILDAFGIALASTKQTYSKKTLSGILDIGGKGDYPIIGSNVGLPYRESALMNGFLIHSLDFDDTHVAGVIHSTASALPSVLSAARRHSVDGKKALSAYIAAIECSSRIGMAAKGGFHKKGFHPTGLIGAFGSTIAAGCLASLSVKELIQAQGTVYSMASGNLEFLKEGAWTKRMHPGWASVCGLTAVSMCKHGFEGVLSPYEGRYGVYNTCSSEDIEVDIGLVTKGLGKEWEMLSVGVKPYPACHLTHSCIDATRKLFNKHSLSLEDVKKVVARVAEDSLPVVGEPLSAKRRPSSGYEAQFSLPYLVASAIVRDRFTLADLEKSSYTEPQVISICDKVFCEPMEGSLYPKYFSGEIEVTTKNNEVFIQREEINRGADVTPLEPQEIISKFEDNASLVLSKENYEAAINAVLNIDDICKFTNIIDYFKCEGHL